MSVQPCKEKCDEHDDIKLALTRMVAKQDVMLQLHGADPRKVITHNPGKVDQNYVGIVWKGRNSTKILLKLVAAVTVPGLISLFLIGGLKLLGVI